MRFDEYIEIIVKEGEKSLKERKDKKDIKGICYMAGALAMAKILLEKYREIK